MDFDNDRGETRPEFASLTANIVSAYVSKNKVAHTDLPRLIDDTFTSLVRARERADEPETEELIPAVPVKRSATPDYVVCLDCGRQFQSLRKHLGTSHGLTGDEYREKWGLAYDHPLVAANYAAMRSKLAKKLGLGRKGRGS